MPPTTSQATDRLLECLAATGNVEDCGTPIMYVSSCMECEKAKEGSNDLCTGLVLPSLAGGAALVSGVACFALGYWLACRRLARKERDAMVAPEPTLVTPVAFGTIAGMPLGAAAKSGDLFAAVKEGGKITTTNHRPAPPPPRGSPSRSRPGRLRGSRIADATLVPCVVNAQPLTAELVAPQRKSSVDMDRDFSPTKLKHALSEVSRDSDVDSDALRNCMEA
jgi:hypothetical protein